MEKNESPDGDIHVYSERNCPLGHFPCLGKLSLSLISVQKDCLISLRSIRHHSFFSTIAESESSSRGMKSSSSFAFSHCTHVCHHGGTIIPYLIAAELPKQPKIQMLLQGKLIMRNHSYTNHGINHFVNDSIVLHEFVFNEGEKKSKKRRRKGQARKKGG